MPRGPIGRSLKRKRDKDSSAEEKETKPIRPKAPNPNGGIYKELRLTRKLLKETLEILRSAGIGSDMGSWFTKPVVNQFGVNNSVLVLGGNQNLDKDASAVKNEDADLRPAGALGQATSSNEGLPENKTFLRKILENQADTPDGDSNEAKGGSKLDNLSREDLVKFVKKQMVLLQKSKSHGDELSRELAETKEKLKNVKTATKDADEDDAEEKENLIQAYNASQTALEESASKMASLTEQVNCLQQKNETLTSLYHSMQTELDSMASRNKELENSLFLMSEARDEAVKQVEVRQTSVGPTASNDDTFVCSKCGEMRTKMDELTIILDELRQKVEPVETERNQFKLDLSQSQEKLAKAAVFIDKLKKERQQLKEQIAELQSSQSTLSDLQEALDAVRQEQIAANNEKVWIVAELENAKTDLAKSLEDFEKVAFEKTELVSQLTVLQQTFDCVEHQRKDVQNDRDVCAERLAISQRNLDDIAQQLSSLQEEKTSVLAFSVELQKSFDDVVERLEAVTSEKRAADEELQCARANLVDAARIAGDGVADAKKLQDVEELLRRANEELAATKAELESEKLRREELEEERVSRSDETRAESVEPVSQPSDEAADADENALRDNLVRELNLQIDQLKDELRLGQRKEQEASAMNEELSNQISELKSNLGKSVGEKNNAGTDVICDKRVQRNSGKDPEEETGEPWTPMSAQTSISETDAAQPTEVLQLREKLAEWETMMQMLQTERDDMERELVRMGERERRDGRLLEEILLTLQNALKGRDLFHDQTKTMEDNGAIYARLSVLQSIIDETNFERDEMREKIQHLTEQVADLERRSSGAAGGGDTASTTISEGKDDGEFLGEGSNGVGGEAEALPGKARLAESVSEHESVVSSQNEKLEELSDDIVEWKRMLEVERTNSEKLRSSHNEMQGIVEGLTAEKEEMEKTLEEALRASSHVRSDIEQLSENKVEEDGKTTKVTLVSDNQTLLCEAAKVDAEVTEDSRVECLMTEQLQRRTVRKSGPLVIQVLSEDERSRLLEENRKLADEIRLLEKQLETFADHSLVIVKPYACVDDVVSSEKDGIGEGSEASQVEKDSVDSSPTRAADEVGETVGDTGDQFTLDKLKKEIAEAECLLQEKRDELSRLSEEIDSTEKKISETELDRPREDFSEARAEFEVLLQNKTSDIERLQTEFFRVSEELENNRERETEMVTLREELGQLRKEKFSERRQAMILESTAVQTDADDAVVISSENDAEIRRLKEEHDRLIKDAEERVEEYKNQLRIAVEESGMNKSSDSDEISLKDAEIRRLEDTLSGLREEMESCVREKDLEINALREKIIAGKEKSEELDRKLTIAREEVENHLKEILHLKSELSRVQDEAAETKAASSMEMENLKAELATVKVAADERESQLDKAVEDLRLELATVKVSADERESQLDKTVEDLKVELRSIAQVMDEKNQTIKELEEAVLHARQSVERETEEKNTRIANLEDLVEKLRKDSEDLAVEKAAKIRELEERLNENLDGHIRDTDSEIENLRVELKTVREQSEGRLKDKDDEIERLKVELVEIKEEIEKNAVSMSSEIERLTAERELWAGLEDSVKVRDAEIERLKLEVVEVKTEFEERWKNSERAAENARTELLAVNEESQNQIEARDHQIGQLQEEILKLKDIEGRLECAEGQLKDIEGQLKDAEGQLKDAEGQLKDAEGRLEDTEGQLKDVEGQLKDKISANERLDAELVKIHEQNEKFVEQNEKLIEQKDSEIKSLKDDFEKSGKEADDLVASKDSELQNLLAEIDRLREESGRMRASSDAKVEDLEKKLEAFQNDASFTENLNSELRELRAECERLRLVVDKREGEIEQLKEEVARGKSVMETSFERRENETLDQSTSSGILESSPQQMTSSPSSSGETTVAALEQKLKEREERENKLKQLTLKAKKESADLRAKLTSSQKELDIANAKLVEANNQNGSNQSIQYQSLHTEYDKLESLYDAEKSARLELQKSLKQAIDELSNVKVTAAELTEEKSKMNWDLQRLEREKKEVEALRLDKEQEVQAERIQREQLARDKSELEKRATKAESQLRDTEDESKMEIRQLHDQLKAAKQELDFAKTEIQQTNMMDLEIADYERAVKTLHVTVADRDAKLKSLQEEADQQQEQRAALQKLLDSSGSQYSQLDDHCSKLKQLLVKSKKDLAEAKKLEGEQRTADAQMKGQLERLTQLTEEQKIQISSLIAENQKQSDKLRLHSDSHQRTAQSLEQRVQSLEQDLQMTRSEMAATQAEYDGYKVRVHSVLKTQKTRSSAGDDVSVEQERFERQQMEKSLESLKMRLADVSQQMVSVSSEYDLLQEEHDRLQTRHSKLIAEMEANERGWRDRLEKLNTESSFNSMKKVEVIQQLTVQSEIISASYKEQIQSIHEEHQRVVESLRHELEATEIELDRHRARSQNVNQNLPLNSSISFPALEHETSSSDRVLEFVKELRPEERQSGEGSETVDDVHAKMSSAANHSLLPFEQLLDSTQMDDTMSVKTMESTAEEMMLRANLISSEKRIEHLSQILNESEATVLRLTEQASILKGEIRRMERNQERETAISNMEYLKNVVYKFMTLKSGDERLQLIPVLTTMLKFSPDEKDRITAIAAGSEGVPPADQDAAGWSTYLHRWSGLV